MEEAAPRFSSLFYVSWGPSSEEHVRGSPLLQLQQHPAHMLTQTGVVAMGTRICAQMRSLSEEDRMGLLPGEMGVLLSRGGWRERTIGP